MGQRNLIGVQGSARESPAATDQIIEREISGNGKCAWSVGTTYHRDPGTIHMESTPSYLLFLLSVDGPPPPPQVRVRLAPV